MIIFPTQYSTLSSLALQTFLQQQYGMNNVLCRLKLRGVSDTYQVETASGKYILKIFRSCHRSTEELLGEIELLQYLHQRQIGVAVPVADLEGNSLQSFQAAEGLRNGILYHFAAGRPVIEQEEEQIRQSGEFLAKMHLQTEGLSLQHNRKAYSLDTMLHKPLQVIRPAFTDYPEGYAWLQKTAAETEAALANLDLSVFSEGVCHYDFMPKNYHHDTQGQITLFDFDFAGWGWLANDLASYFVYLTLMDLGKEETHRRFGIFTKAYQQYRKIHPEELKALPYLCFLFVTFYLRYQYENFDDHTNVYFGPGFLRERIKMIDNQFRLFTID